MNCEVQDPRAMSRLNGRVHHTGSMHSNPVQYQAVPTQYPPPTPTPTHPQYQSTPVHNLNEDFEPSCLVRTPSGNVYIPTG